jgi:hypothetical protein
MLKVNSRLHTTTRLIPPILAFSAALFFTALWIRGNWVADYVYTHTTSPRIMIRSCLGHAEAELCWYPPPSGPVAIAHDSETLLPYYENWQDFDSTTHSVVADDTMSDHSFLVVRYRSGKRDPNSNEIPDMVATWVSITVPHWLIALPLWLLTIVCSLRRQKSARLGLCPKCSYDLRAHAPGSRCPECGKAN